MIPPRNRATHRPRRVGLETMTATTTKPPIAARLKHDADELRRAMATMGVVNAPDKALRVANPGTLLDTLADAIAAVDELVGLLREAGKWCPRGGKPPRDLNERIEAAIKEHSP